MDRPTFSQAWSRVSRLTPVLRPQVRIHRQLFRGEPWHVVHDPVSNNFFRLNPVAYHLVGLLDGKRSIDDAWRLTLERFGDAAPTQNEVIGLLAQLNESNLLRVDLPADAAPLLKRQRTRRIRQWGGQLMSIMALKFPLFNPDRVLEWLLPLFKPILNKWGLALWAGWLLFCLYNFLPSFDAFINDTSSVLDPNNWGWMIVVFLLVKTWHELGHGIICKRLGGLVPEVGIMLLVLFPAPYVDATSSWNFPDKWKRLLVGAAGMMFELALAGAAALVWLYAEPGSLLKQIAFNAVFLASITTLLFNGNPLLRFDGYYMLSDLLEVPNLYDRSARQIRWLFQRYGFGMPNATPVSTLKGEQWLLVIYGILSQIYKVIIMFGIALFIASAIPTLGIMIAVWSIFAWAILPSLKFIRWLATSPALYRHRFRAASVSLGLAVVLIVSLGVIRVPDRRRALGVIESAERSEVSVQTDGFIREVKVESGSLVKAGDVILIAESPELEAQLLDIEAQLRRLWIAQRGTLADQPVESQMNMARIDAMAHQLKEVQRRVDELSLRSPRDGVLVGSSLKHLEGQFLRRGQLVAQVEDMGTLRVTAMVDQASNASPFFDAIESVELRTAGQLERVIPSSLVRRMDSGRTKLPHPSLGYAGGGSIATDAEDREGQTTQRPQFELWLSLPPGEADANGNVARALGVPGERVYVRFTLETRAPLMFQWIHRLRQVIRDRLT